MTAFAAGALPGGERDGLVEEEQRRVATRMPLRHAAVPERQDAGEPCLALVVPHDVAGPGPLVQPAASAHPGTSRWRRDDVPAGRYPVARRAGAGHTALSSLSSIRLASAPPR